MESLGREPMNKLFVGGRWLEGAVPVGKLEIFIPATGVKIATLPYGGREGGPQGIGDYVDVKYVPLGGIPG